MFIAFIVIVHHLIFIVPAWKICKRVGLNPALSLLILIPLVNLVAVWVFAFAQWPAGNASPADSTKSAR